MVKFSMDKSKTSICTHLDEPALATRSRLEAMVILGAYALWGISVILVQYVNNRTWAGYIGILSVFVLVLSAIDWWRGRWVRAIIMALAAIITLSDTIAVL